MLTVIGELVCRRILVKVSGEALMGEQASHFDAGLIRRLAQEIGQLVEAGVQVGLVIGAGNIVRGVELAAVGVDRIIGDQMGMLATIVNALVMQDALQRYGVPSRVLSSLRVEHVGESYERESALRHLGAGRVAIFAAGTGNPLFTTDSAASLRAIEISADLLIKATKVDGVFSADPVTDPGAEFYAKIDYGMVLERRLKVMDEAAIILCRDHDMPIRVVNIFRSGTLLRLMQGEEIGSLVHGGERDG
jgi:uridylate kinase